MLPVIRSLTMFHINWTHSKGFLNLRNTFPKINGHKLNDKIDAQYKNSSLKKTQSTITTKEMFS